MIFLTHLQQQLPAQGVGPPVRHLPGGTTRGHASSVAGQSGQAGTRSCERPSNMMSSSSAFPRVMHAM